MLRSERMSLLTLYLCKQNARKIVVEIGEHELLHFVPIRKVIDETTNNEKRTESLEMNNPRSEDTKSKQIEWMSYLENEAFLIEKYLSKCNYLLGEIKKDENLFNKINIKANEKERCKTVNFELMTEEIDRHFSRIVGFGSAKREVQHQLMKINEKQAIFHEVENFLGCRYLELLCERNLNGFKDLGKSSGSGESLRSVALPSGSDTMEDLFDAEFLAGTVEAVKVGLLEKVLNQTLYRNLIFHHSTEEIIDKSIFIVFIHGKNFLVKAEKICRSLGAYLIPHGVFRKKIDLLKLYTAKNQLKELAVNNSAAERDEKTRCASQIMLYRFYLMKQVKVLNVLKMLKINPVRNCLLGKAWICDTDLSKIGKLSIFINDAFGAFGYDIRDSLIKEKSEKMVEPVENNSNNDANEEIENDYEITPPTYFKLNDFTAPFQESNNVYGVPSYREINPAFFYLFTLPFLFGAMFGDIGHGSIIVVFILGISIYYKERNPPPALELLFQTRYLLLSCGVSTIYFGFLYSDFLALPFPIASSQYKMKGNKYVRNTGYTFPFGIDPAWHNALNGSNFINGVKMNLSMIIGFFHMFLGYVLGVTNQILKKDFINLFTTVIPQFISFFSITGYAIFLIFLKWLVFIDRPDIVSTIIDIFLNPFKIKDQIFPGQLCLQLCLLVVFLVTLPWMLLAKPLYYIFHKKTGKKCDSADLWINTSIHLVEHCIGLISNQSSYLRLWAVSLAHNQLTAVLNKLILESTWPLKIIFAPIWFALTCMLLLGLEGLSAILHALRLNWIEFNSKYFEGRGYIFDPLRFEVEED